jgi:hypothetical protein
MSAPEGFDFVRWLIVLRVILVSSPRACLSENRFPLFGITR